MKGCRACGNLFIVLFMAARLIIAELEHKPQLPLRGGKSVEKSNI